MSIGASRNLPEYIINCSEIPSRSVWDSHCHLDFLARKLARERNMGGNILDQLRILVGSLKRRVVAIGECGLDISHKNEVPLDVQKRVFGAQVQLALDLNMPLVLHIRGAEEEAFEVLRKKRVPSDWPMHYHCFKGNVEQAEHWFNDYPASKIQMIFLWPPARGMGGRGGGQKSG